MLFREKRGEKAAKIRDSKQANKPTATTTTHKNVTRKEAGKSSTSTTSRPLLSVGRSSVGLTTKQVMTVKSAIFRLLQRKLVRVGILTNDGGVPHPISSSVHLSLGHWFCHCVAPAVGSRVSGLERSKKQPFSGASTIHPVDPVPFPPPLPTQDETSKEREREREREVVKCQKVERLQAQIPYWGLNVRQ